MGPSLLIMDANHVLDDDVKTWVSGVACTLPPLLFYKRRIPTVVWNFVVTDGGGSSTVYLSSSMSGKENVPSHNWSSRRYTQSCEPSEVVCVSEVLDPLPVHPAFVAWNFAKCRKTAWIAFQKAMAPWKFEEVGWSLAMPWCKRAPLTSRVGTRPFGTVESFTDLSAIFSAATRSRSGVSALKMLNS